MGLIVLMYRFILLCGFAGALKGIERGDLRGVVMLAIVAGLWFWRWTLREGPYALRAGVIQTWHFVGRMRRSH